VDQSSQTPESGLKRLNWGCGPCIAPGWVNADRNAGAGIDLACDIRAGLPVESNNFDYVVSIHALQDLPYLDLLPALGELYRVMKPGGVLRLGLPDLDKALQAYLRKDAGYFYVPDQDARSIGAKLITQIIWYGSVRTPCTYDFIEELLLRVGFQFVVRCAYKQSQSQYTEIIALDNRERESLFIEATK
jgi:ubiquinone/menaquinone biosynthesis C-methylase UbiE